MSQDRQDERQPSQPPAGFPASEQGCDPQQMLQQAMDLMHRAQAMQAPNPAAYAGNFGNMMSGLGGARFGGAGPSMGPLQAGVMHSYHPGFNRLPSETFARGIAGDSEQYRPAPVASMSRSTSRSGNGTYSAASGAQPSSSPPVVKNSKGKRKRVVSGNIRDGQASKKSRRGADVHEIYTLVLGSRADDLQPSFQQLQDLDRHTTHTEMIQRDVSIRRSGNAAVDEAAFVQAVMDSFPGYKAILESLQLPTVAGGEGSAYLPCYPALATRLRDGEKWLLRPRERPLDIHRSRLYYTKERASFGKLLFVVPHVLAVLESALPHDKPLHASEYHEWIASGKQPRHRPSLLHAGVQLLAEWARRRQPNEVCNIDVTMMDRMATKISDDTRQILTRANLWSTPASTGSAPAHAPSADPPVAAGSAPRARAGSSPPPPLPSTAAAVERRRSAARRGSPASVQSISSGDDGSDLPDLDAEFVPVRPTRSQPTAVPGVRVSATSESRESEDLQGNPDLSAVAWKALRAASRPKHLERKEATIAIQKFDPATEDGRASIYRLLLDWMKVHFRTIGLDSDSAVFIPAFRFSLANAIDAGGPQRAVLSDVLDFALGTVCHASSGTSHIWFQRAPAGARKPHMERLVDYGRLAAVVFLTIGVTPPQLDPLLYLLTFLSAKDVFPVIEKVGACELQAQLAMHIDSADSPLAGKPLLSLLADLRAATEWSEALLERVRVVCEEGVWDHVGLSQRQPTAEAVRLLTLALDDALGDELAYFKEGFELGDSKLPWQAYFVEHGHRFVHKLLQPVRTFSQDVLPFVRVGSTFAAFKFTDYDACIGHFKSSEAALQGYQWLRRYFARTDAALTLEEADIQLLDPDDAKRLDVIRRRPAAFVKYLAGAALRPSNSVLLKVLLNPIDIPRSDRVLQDPSGPFDAFGLLRLGCDKMAWSWYGFAVSDCVMQLKVACPATELDEASYSNFENLLDDQLGLDHTSSFLGTASYGGVEFRRPNRRPQPTLDPRPRGSGMAMDAPLDEAAEELQMAAALAASRTSAAPHVEGQPQASGSGTRSTPSPPPASDAVLQTPRPPPQGGPPATDTTPTNTKPQGHEVAERASAPPNAYADRLRSRTGTSSSVDLTGVDDVQRTLAGREVRNPLAPELWETS